MGLIKDAVKRECRMKGITQVDLAQLCDMKTGNLSNQISRDDTVQLGLVKKICQKLDISIGLLLGENEHFNDFQTSDVEEHDMIFEQLKKVLQEGDDAVVEQILGKIAREYMNVTQKKDSSRSKASGE